MGQGVERDQRVALRADLEFAQRTVADVQVEFDRRFGAQAQHLADGGGDRAAAGDDEHALPGMGVAHVVERRDHAGDEIGVRGHALGLRGRGHPLAQAAAQQPEMLTHLRGRACRRNRSGVHRAHQRLAVELVQARQRNRLVPHLQAFLDAGQRLRMAAQRAGEHGVEAHALAAQPGAQAPALLSAQRAQLVVVGCAQGGLAMAHEVKGSHVGVDCAGASGGPACGPRLGVVRRSSKEP